ncbi:MAG: hypothetical protein ACD_78C00212G0002 [uncultured bacterium (gcode 4)]|uniref:Uncharacterized protein n=1 Tax=uncultured bacterium (gcode 4) TaxID=1234023 RepID=K1XY63_9BACT|nr:MAG: hypothetical protein ACD_78C00212G0002 [uncultured bacterium (gcode 4)]
MTQPGSKTFYSFKPDGYPQDAYLYTGAILLKKSSPLIFFTIISPTNESKIKQNNYIIEYSPDVHFRDTEVVLGSNNMVDVSITNESDKTVDIGFYQVQSESSMTEIPEGTMLAPDKTYTVSFEYTGTSPIVLRSPDGEEWGILQVVRAEPKVEIKPTPYKYSQNSTVMSPQVQKPEENIPLAEPVTESVTETPVSSEPTLTPTPEPVIAPVVPTPAVSPENVPATSDIAADIKTSVSESGTGIQPVYIFSLLSIAVLLGAVQFWVRKKKN